MRQGEQLDSTELKFTHPICPACGVPMWLTHFEPKPTKPSQAKCLLSARHAAVRGLKSCRPKAVRRSFFQSGRPTHAIVWQV
jgi:hypothetical protein